MASLFGRRRDEPQRRAHGRPGANALTASGQKVSRRDADAMRRLGQPWQARAFAYHDLLGPINYASQFYSRALSSLRLYAAEIDENGDYVETTFPLAIEQLDRIQDPGGGRTTLLGSYGRLMFIAGECNLFVSRDMETDMEQWEFLSTDELKVTDSGYLRYRAPSLAAEQYSDPADEDFEPVEDDDAVAYRIWRRHPRFSSLATSTMQSILDDCEELILLTQSVRARSRSAVAGNGILIVNGKVTPVPLEPVPDEDPNEDPFVSDFTEAMTAPIINEGSASAVTPLVVRVDTDNLDQVMKHIQIVDPLQLYPETGMRSECIARIALGLDMPPEVLMGTQGVNHWGSWMIDEQSWKAHLQPVAQALVDDLTSAYFRPSLREMGVKDWDRYCIAFDATAVINHPDRTKDAKDLHDRVVISDEAHRDSAGFDDDDAPDEEEVNRRIGILIRDGSLAVYGIPQLRGAQGIEPDAGEIEQGAQGGTVEPGTSSPETAKESPTEPSQTDQPGNGYALASKILGASDLALYRARELAGARIRNYAKRDLEAAKRIDGVRHGQVAALLGRDAVRALGAPTDRQLVAGATEAVADALRLWGLDEALAEPLGARIEQHAARTLYDEKPKPLPQSFINYVLGIDAGRKEAQL